MGRRWVRTVRDSGIETRCAAGPCRLCWRTSFLDCRDGAWSIGDSGRHPDCTPVGSTSVSRRRARCLGGDRHGRRQHPPRRGHITRRHPVGHAASAVARDARRGRSAFGAAAQVPERSDVRGRGPALTQPGPAAEGRHLRSEERSDGPLRVGRRQPCIVEQGSQARGREGTGFGVAATRRSATARPHGRRPPGRHR